MSFYVSSIIFIIRRIIYIRRTDREQFSLSYRIGTRLFTFIVMTLYPFLHSFTIYKLPSILGLLTFEHKYELFMQAKRLHPGSDITFEQVEPYLRNVKESDHCICIIHNIIVNYHDKTPSELIALTEHHMTM